MWVFNSMVKERLERHRKKKDADSPAIPAADSAAPAAAAPASSIPAPGTVTKSKGPSKIKAAMVDGPFHFDFGTADDLTPVR